MYKQLDYTRTLIPSDTGSNAKVDVCGFFFLVVLRDCPQSTRKRPVFLTRTSVIFFPGVVLLPNET